MTPDLRGDPLGSEAVIAEAPGEETTVDTGPRQLLFLPESENLQRSHRAPRKTPMEQSDVVRADLDSVWPRLTNEWTITHRRGNIAQQKTDNQH